MTENQFRRRFKSLKSMKPEDVDFMAKYKYENELKLYLKAELQIMQYRLKHGKADPVVTTKDEDEKHVFDM